MKHRRPFVTWKNLETDEPVPGPIHCIRLFAFKNHRMNFVEVYLWKYAHQMRACRQSSRRQAARTMAFFHEFHEQRKEPDRRGRRVGSKKLGEIHFCQPFLTVDTIAHEVHHAVLAWGRRLKRPLPTTTEESEQQRHIGRWSPEELSATLQGQWTDHLLQAFLDRLQTEKRK